MNERTNMQINDSMNELMNRLVNEGRGFWENQLRIEKILALRKFLCFAFSATGLVAQEHQIISQ